MPCRPTDVAAASPAARAACQASTRHPCARPGATAPPGSSPTAAGPTPPRPPPPPPAGSAPPSAASSPAATQRPVSTAYSDQAASAVNSDSLYAIDCTIPTGSTPTAPPRRSRPGARTHDPPTAKIPQAAASEATELDGQPRVRRTTAGSRPTCRAPARAAAGRTPGSSARPRSASWTVAVADLGDPGVPERVPAGRQQLVRALARAAPQTARATRPSARDRRAYSSSAGAARRSAASATPPGRPAPGGAVSAWARSVTAPDYRGCFRARPGLWTTGGRTADGRARTAGGRPAA